MKLLDSNALSVVEEVLGAIRVVKAFSREDYERERFVENPRSACGKCSACKSCR